jgi:hypothetical protein
MVVAACQHGKLSLEWLPDGSLIVYVSFTEIYIFLNSKSQIPELPLVHIIHLKDAEGMKKI